MRQGFPTRCTPLLAVWLLVWALVVPPAPALSAADGPPVIRTSGKACCAQPARAQCTACCCVEAPGPSGRPAPAPGPVSPGLVNGDSPVPPAMAVAWVLPDPATCGNPPANPSSVLPPPVPVLARHGIFLI